MALSTGEEVLVTGEHHPHKGAIGVIVEEGLHLAGKQLYLIFFDQRHHGRRGCYASPEQITTTQ